jgi:myo-inositol-1(or 4)-monophosphatase
MSTALINVMSAAAIKAGKGVLRDFSEVDQLQVSRKGTANFVTATDVRTEKFLQRELLKARPSFGFLLEEGGEVAGKDSRFRWVVDPIDGTSNFIHAIPYFCISIGLEERSASGKSDIIAGVVYDPIQNELFAAEKGKGAFMNGRRINTSGRPTIEDSLLVTGNPGYSSNPKGESYKLLGEVIEAGATLRYFGATALDLAYLAAGRLDACWYYMVQPWDVAAGLLIIQEAGGIVTSFDGKPVDIYSKSLLATNKHLHSPMQKLLTKFV